MTMYTAAVNGAINVSIARERTCETVSAAGPSTPRTATAMPVIKVPAKYATRWTMTT